MAQLNWGMIGGGEGSQIGPAHRLGALADGHFRLVAGALDHRPEAGHVPVAQGLAEERPRFPAAGRAAVDHDIRGCVQESRLWARLGRWQRLRVGPLRSAQSLDCPHT